MIADWADVCGLALGIVFKRMLVACTSRNEGIEQKHRVESAEIF